MDIQKKANESPETFSLRAFGIGDEHWCMQLQRGTTKLDETHKATEEVIKTKSRWELLKSAAKNERAQHSRRDSLAEQSSKRTVEVKNAEVACDANLIGATSDLRARLA